VRGLELKMLGVRAVGRGVSRRKNLGVEVLEVRILGLLRLGMMGLELMTLRTALSTRLRMRLRMGLTVAAVAMSMASLKPMMSFEISHLPGLASREKLGIVSRDMAWETIGMRTVGGYLLIPEEKAGEKKRTIKKEEKREDQKDKRKTKKKNGKGTKYQKRREKKIIKKAVAQREESGGRGKGAPPQLPTSRSQNNRGLDGVGGMMAELCIIGRTRLRSRSDIVL
jgi:hypothetical protein